MVKDEEYLTGVIIYENKETKSSQKLMSNSYQSTFLFFIKGNWKLKGEKNSQDQFQTSGLRHWNDIAWKKES